MKKLFVGFAALAVLGLCAGSGLAAKYTPGVYKGASPGHQSKKHPGKIAVEVTVSADAITDIKVVEFVQTEKKKQGERNANAKKMIPEAIMAKQSLVIDSVAKASESSVGIELAVAEALHKATAAYKDGTYKGKARGYDKPPKHPGEIEVEVTVAGGKISDIKLLTFKQTEKGKQGKRNASVKEKIPADIIAAQTIAVDAVTKASFASNGIKIAVARALEQAR